MQIYGITTKQESLYRKMEKRKDVQIYELCYKPVSYVFWDNTLYTPLQVGAERTNTSVCETKDNVGVNISFQNDFYSETTGTYWIWKNAPETKYIGQCQYRRRLQFQENEDFDKIFEKYGIIVNNPIKVGTTLNTHMKTCHPQIDIKLLTEIIRDKYGQYYDFWDKHFMRGNVLYYSTSYVMDRSTFDEYCNFLFGVLGYYVDYYGLSDPVVLRRHVSERLAAAQPTFVKRDIKYQSLIGGFIQERLASVFIRGKFGDDMIMRKMFVLFEGIKI